MYPIDSIERQPWTSPGVKQNSSNAFRNSLLHVPDWVYATQRSQPFFWNSTMNKMITALVFAAIASIGMPAFAGSHAAAAPAAAPAAAAPAKDAAKPEMKKEEKKAEKK
jgi:hypothetical protein